MTDVLAEAFELFEPGHDLAVAEVFERLRWAEICGLLPIGTASVELACLVVIGTGSRLVPA